jgi:hypothetical protein
MAEERAEEAEENSLIHSCICFGLSQYLLRVVPKPPLSHRSISYGGTADTATGDGRYCGLW